MFFLAEYVNMIIISVLGATLFLGGYAGPSCRDPVADHQDRRPARPVHLAAGHPAPPEVRPAHEVRLEDLLPVATLNLVVTAIIVGLGFSN